MPYLSPQQARLQDDIRGLIRGEVCCDEITCQLYSTDAGILQCQPQGVVWPRDVNDVVACVQYAAEKHIPIHPRGAGTGTTGEVLGSGLVLDFSRLMRRLVALNRDSVVVQPGMNAQRLNNVLDKIQSRTFAPVSGFQPATTIGSILARNGAGIRWLQYGFPDEYLLELKIVLANGEILTLNRESLPHAIDPHDTPQNTSHKTSQNESITKDPNITVNTNTNTFTNTFANTVANTLSGTLSSSSLFFGGRDTLARGIALARGIVLGKEHPVADDVYRILSPSLSRINSALSRQVPVNRAGYSCYRVLQGEEGHSVDLAQLLLGSEGTLGLIVEAKLKTLPCPKRQAGAVFFFNSFENAMLAVEPIRSFRPALCELVDRRRLNMVCECDSRFQQWIPAEAEAILFVELDVGNLLNSENNVQVQHRLSQLIETIQTKKHLSFRTLRIETSEGFELFDDFLRRSELILFRMRRSFQPLPIFDDLAVPIPALCDFLPELLNILKRYEITASISGHVGQGHLRVHPIIDFSKPKPFASLEHLTEEVYRLVLTHGGTVSSENGTGLLKTQFITTQFPDLISVFRNIKYIFDPNHLFNPNKIVPDPAVLTPSPWTTYLRHGLSCRGSEHPATKRISDSTFQELNRVGSGRANSNLDSGILPYMEATEIIADHDGLNKNSDTDIADSNQNTLSASDKNAGNFSSQIELQLKWEPQHIFEPTHRCNGCGECFRNDFVSRMCPLFRHLQAESAVPRAKANLLRGILAGDLELEMLTQDKAKEIADYCIQCGMCRIECPAEVDISNLAFRCKSAYVAAHGLSLEDHFFSRIDSMLRFLAMISCPVNWAISNPFMRWLLEKLLQIPQSRTIPKLAKVTFLARTQWSNWLVKPLPSVEHFSSNRVALFVDTFANHFDTRLADLAVRILEHNHCNVYIPSRQRPSGLSSFSVGHLDRAERLARHNSLLLADLIRQGYHIVTLEPASASCLSQDYRNILNDLDTMLVSSRVVDFSDFLLQRYREGQFRLDFRPQHKMAGKTVGYHAPCRSITQTTRRTDIPTPAEELLRLIPELNVRRIECGCCGMAGMFGFKRKNYRRSLRMGVALFKELRRPEIDFGVSDCSACCLQMEHGARKKTLHPIRILAAAYGFAPEIAGN
ncbi:MAG: FAD-binding protein [Planctomycetaceae bacterium]|jgi:FAD/FMN-containing dehydrogenase/Fe-S oxidoreductase|nr:FAD-binding protein [Planctomycetaceae bacterium]